MEKKAVATEREKEILDAIISYIKKHQYPPTVREIGDMVGLKSSSSVQSHLVHMREKGIIETDDNFGTPRAIRVPGYRFAREPE